MTLLDSPLFLRADRDLPQFVDAAPIRAHLAMLAGHGIGYKRAADLAGLSPEVVRTIAAGRRGTGSRSGKLPQRVLRETAADLMRVTVDVNSRALVDATGSRRRVQALIVQGWSQIKIAERLGMNASQFGRVLRQGSVRQTTYEAIRGLFEEIWNVAPPMDTEHDRAAAQRCSGYARALGWLPPLAWDDIDHDDTPDPLPVVHVDEVAIELAVAGEKVHLNRLERISAILVLNRDHHMSDWQISDHLRIHKDSIQRYRRDARIPAAVDNTRTVIN